VVGDYALIFGHLGAPALGADGSAIATVLSFTLGAAVYATLWLRRKLVLDRGRLTEGVDGELCRRILRVGVPTSVEQLFFNLGLFLFLGVISGFGTDAVAAYIIGVRVISFSLIPGMGFQIAASTLVGQHLGARQPERAARSGWGATAGAAVAMSVLGLAIALMARSIAAWFGAVGEPALDLAATFLLIVCAAQPFMALEFGIGGSLKGAGDTRFPLFALLVGLFVFRLGGALLVLRWFGGPIAAIWACLLLDYSIKGALLWLRFQRGHWKTIRV
jgi:putative MATE family efflux protein